MFSEIWKVVNQHAEIFSSFLIIPKIYLINSSSSIHAGRLHKFLIKSPRCLSFESNPKRDNENIFNYFIRLRVIESAIEQFTNNSINILSPSVSARNLLLNQRESQMTQNRSQKLQSSSGTTSMAKDGKVSLSLPSSAPTPVGSSPTPCARSVKINQSFSNSNVVYDYGHLFPSHGNLIHRALHFDALWRNQNALCIFSHSYFYCYCPRVGFFPALPLRTKCA